MDLGDVQPPLVGGDSQSPALTQGVVDDALVFSQHLSRGVAEGAVGVVPPGVGTDEGGVIPVGDKADVLAVPLPALTSPCSRAMERISCLDRAARGKRTRESCSWVRDHST